MKFDNITCLKEHALRRQRNVVNYILKDLEA